MIRMLARAEWPARPHLDRPRCAAAASADPAAARDRWALRGALVGRSPLEPPGARVGPGTWECGNGSHNIKITLRNCISLTRNLRDWMMINVD